MEAVGARRVVSRALADPALAVTLTSGPIHVVAAGKAASAMASAFVGELDAPVRHVLAIGTHAHHALPQSIEWMEAGHPFPDGRSERAGARALAVAGDVPVGGTLVVLLSGGASALMAAPIDGLSLADKVRVTQVMMHAGADIEALNTVRRHLSRVKGGRLAAACKGATVTLAISDVVGDALTAIGSGPGVPDPTTWADVDEALSRWGGHAAHPAAVRAIVLRGMRGDLPDTPKPGDAACARATARVIGGRREAMAGASAAAIARGYHPIVMSDAVSGEAREFAPGWWSRVQRLAAGTPGPVCVVSSGETTVRVSGAGTGGRNLEFMLALAQSVAAIASPVAMASVGTDGVDGSSGVAGAVVDSTTISRALAHGLKAPAEYLAANDSFAFFAPLDDVIRLGRTDTNVGDLQVCLLDTNSRERDSE